MVHTFKTQLTKDLPNKKLFVEREFAAPVARVWDAWTKPELLDQWWAPKPYKAVTKSMDFRPGGKWVYAMVGPDSVPMYAYLSYDSITPQQRFTGTDGFCDEAGTPNFQFPSMGWNNGFHATATGTKVMVEITFDSEADLMKIIEMGFEQGFTMAHGNLDELLAQTK